MFFIFDYLSNSSKPSDSTVIHDAENAFTATVEKLENQSDYASYLDGCEYLESLSTDSSDNDYSDIDD